MFYRVKSLLFIDAVTVLSQSVCRRCIENLKVFSHHPWLFALSHLQKCSHRRFEQQSKIASMSSETAPPIDQFNTIHANLAALRDFPVTIQFQAIGSAPTMKKTKFRIGGKSKFADLIMFLKRALKMEESPYLYVQNCFTPSPEEYVGDLCKCFGRFDDTLQIGYSITPAFG
mgnify:CR=1 FL=1